jgi:hypothetical protein
MQSDLVFIDAVDTVNRRRNIDFLVCIAGRYILTRHMDPKGTRREGPCRVVKISPESMTLVAPVNGLIGERVIATVWELGTFEGPVLTTDRHGFAMSVEMSDEERNKFATKIEWYEKHKNCKLPENRKFKRIVPRTPGSTILLSDGTLMEACIIDVSVAGVAVTAGTYPEVGEPLAVGKIVGRVVRHFAGGFAVEFVDLQKPQLLEKLLLAPPQS